MEVLPYHIDRSIVQQSVRYKLSHTYDMIYSVSCTGTKYEYQYKLWVFRGLRGYSVLLYHQRDGDVGLQPSVITSGNGDVGLQ